ncbi:M23 family metallopeptidase [bacterium]|nr:MAG: M23 family metallopeptidase [bacterium]QQR61941.1 MAG: M23 family metallopeptidase [bacterium]QQR62468.1 MAG: M23 family metallopeptidase [bacterium]
MNGNHKKYTHSVSFFHLVTTTCFYVAPLLCILLVYELILIKVTFDELVQMVQLYRIRVDLCDDLLNNEFVCGSCSYSNTMAQSDDAFCQQDQLPNNFLLLNRTAGYLYESASDFFKSQQLDLLLRSFDEQFLDGQSTVRSKKSSVTLVKHRHKAKQKIVPRKRQFVFQTNGFLHWPIEKGKFWLSSLFGPRKKRDGSIGFHHGIDMAAVKGTPVLAAADGVVVEARYNGGFGNSILLRHENRLMTRYAHLHSVLVKRGQKVTRSMIIGTVGETGHIRKKTRDGSHLHFEVFQYNRRMNPLRWLPHG